MKKKNEAVLSSFWGSTGLMLIAGGILYGIFLIFSGVGLIDKFLCFELFGELIVTWNAMSYLTAIKDYRGIMLSFSCCDRCYFSFGSFIAVSGNFPCGSIDGCGMHWIWDHAFMGCCFTV